MTSALPQGWQVFDNAEILAQEAVSLILQQAKQAIEQRGEFHLVTAGGTTPNRCYEILAEQTDQAWHKWFIYMGDERVLPLDDPERNSTSLKQAWLSKVNIPQDQIFLMPTEIGLEQARLAYQQVVDKVENFDCVLLGMGEDGHTASLFPGHNNQDASDSVISVTDSPKPPAERVSLSYKKLNKSKILIKIISGKGKYFAVQQWLKGSELPISLVTGEVTYSYLDKLAFYG